MVVGDGVLTGDASGSKGSQTNFHSHRGHILTWGGAPVDMLGGKADGAPQER